MRSALTALACLVVPALVYACGDDDASSPAPAEDGGTTAPDTAAPDTGLDTGTAPPKPVRCTQAELDGPCGPAGGDCTGPTNTRIDISFPMGANPAQYGNHCVKVKVGTVIDFAGSFVQHPLEPFGGDVPTPIPKQSTNPPAGTSGMPELLITMSTPGTFGYQCEFHPTTMFGAIQVVP